MGAGIDSVWVSGARTWVKERVVCPSPSFTYSAPRLHVNNNESSVPIRDERETIGNLHSSGGTRHYQGTSEHY